MESKKKKKLILIVSLVTIFLITGIIGTFFVVKKINNKSNTSTPATNVSTSIDDKLFQATVDIMEGKVPQNYNGNYKFSYVCSITFNEKLTSEQIKEIVKQQKTNDVNGLLKVLENKKTNEVKNTNEVIVLKNGVFTRSSTETIEKGEYVGNDDLSEVRIYKVDEKLLSEAIVFEMSKTCITEEMITSSTNDSSSNPLRDRIYIYKDFCSNQDPNLVLFTVTYVYEMLEDTTLSIPNSNLGYEI